MLEDLFALKYHLIDFDDQLPVPARGESARDPPTEGALLLEQPVLMRHGVSARLADHMSAGKCSQLADGFKADHALSQVERHILPRFELGAVLSCIVQICFYSTKGCDRLHGEVVVDSTSVLVIVHFVDGRVELIQEE